MGKLFVNYDEEILKSAISYNSKFENLGIDMDNIQNFSNADFTTISKVGNIYKNIKLFRDYSTIKLGKLTQEDTLAYADCMLIDLFPDKKDQIIDFNKLLQFKKIGYGDSGLYFNLENGKVGISRIWIPNKTNGYISSVIAHEKTHALTFKNINPKDLFTMGLELFPTFIERIVLHELEEQFGFDYLELTDRIIRINDINQSIEVLNNIKKVVLRNEVDKYVLDYNRVRFLDYIKAELYSLLLLDIYLQNKSDVIENLNKVFDSKMSLSDFYSHYNLTLSNKQIIPTVKQDLNKVKRLNIIL